MVLRLRRRVPVPRQSLQGWWMILPLAAALGAGGGGGEHAHGRLPPDAGPCRCRGSPGRPPAMVPGAQPLPWQVSQVSMPLHGDCLLTAEGRLLKADGRWTCGCSRPAGGRWDWCAARRRSRRRRSCRRCPPGRRSRSSPSNPPPKPPGAEVGVHARMAVLVVPGLLVRVGEDLIGLVDLLELLLRRPCPRDSGPDGTSGPFFYRPF